VTRLKFSKVVDYRSFRSVRFRQPCNQVNLRVGRDGEPHSIGGYGPMQSLLRNRYDGELPPHLHEIALTALAFWDLTGGSEGFPEQEFDI
jgi:hypothetical protein